MPAAALAAWEPTRPVEFIIPAGTGGGADQMARTIQGIVTKYNLMKQPMVVINKAGGAGGEGFLDVKDSRGNPHKIIITLSNLFTTPLATGIPFNWKDLTPVAMLALDEFVLWVNAEKPYKTVKEYIDAAKAATGTFKMGGTGSKQEDQIITEAIQKVTGAKFIYIPERGGGAVAVQLVGNHVDSTVNNPIEAVAQWRGGQLRPLCVFDSKPLDYKEKIAGDMSWSSIADVQVAGPGHRVSDAARHLHGAGRDQGPGRLLRRSVQEGARDAGVEEADDRWRVQPDLHDRRRIRQVGRERGEAPRRADEGSGIPRASKHTSNSPATRRRSPSTWITAQADAHGRSRILPQCRTVTAEDGNRVDPNRSRIDNAPRRRGAGPSHRSVEIGVAVLWRSSR